MDDGTVQSSFIGEISTVGVEKDRPGSAPSLDQNDLKSVGRVCRLVLDLYVSEG